jgi:hypothetical protein
MSNIFITGNPRSGTSFTRWLFRDAGYFVTNELHISGEMAGHIKAIKNKIRDILDRQSWRHNRGKFNADERMDNIVRDIISSLSFEDVYREKTEYDVFLNKTPGLNFNIVDGLFHSKPKYVVCVRHPYNTILSMCNTKNGSNTDSIKKYSEGDFYRCYSKFIEFNNRHDKFLINNKDRLFVIQVDKLYDYEKRIKKVKEMFEFSDLEFKLEGKFKSLIETWEPRNKGNSEEYWPFSDSQRELLKNDKDLDRICQQYDYNMKDYL